MTKKRTTISMTPETAAALKTLFGALGWEGQRQTFLNAGLHWLGDTASGAMAETIAALQIASGCANGEEWDELIEIIRPEYKE